MKINYAIHGLAFIDLSIVLATALLIGTFHLLNLHSHSYRE